MNDNTDNLKELRQAADIVSVISSYLPLTKRGKNYFGVCPFHDDTNPSMSVSQEKQIYKCFSCGASGNVFNFVMDYEHVSFPESIAILSKMTGVKVANVYVKETPKKYDKYYKIYDLACKFYQNNANVHGSCIAINGHAYIADNLFYKNQGNSDIYLINGNISSETNVFDGNHIIFRNINGDISANMTYWGTNNLDDIETLYNGHVEIDTWLLSDNNINIDNKIIINKYQNRLEAEINSFNTIEYILPVLDN